MILAKSNPSISLQEHSIAVNKLALRLFDYYTTGKYVADFANEGWREIVDLASLYHDIGKATTQFQNKLNNNLDELDSDYKPKDKIPYLHNQVGAAVVYYHIDRGENIRNHVCNIINWHHGIIGDNKDTYEIYSKIDPSDINTILSEGNSLKNIIGSKKDIGKNVFDFYQKEEGRFKLYYCRNIVILADRLISEFYNFPINSDEVDSMVNSILENYLNGNERIIGEPIFDKPSHYDEQRYNSQQEIVDKAVNNKISIINAPAGFGKTGIGLKWLFKTSNKKSVWVCPRNSVAESVYKSVLQELDSHNIKDVKIHLLLAGEIKENNYGSLEPDLHDCDIIITNIDNFLKPTVDNGSMVDFIKLCTTNVIFDEYHELIQDNALFYLFISIMNIRNVMVKDSKTLMISATPNVLNHLWDTASNTSVILPQQYKHYPAIHNKGYKILKGKDIMDNSAVINNHVVNAQRNYIGYNSDKILVHSYYEKSRKESIIDEIYEKYGKQTKRNLNNKPAVISAPIIQASFDISFKDLSESVINPDSSIQRIGRCNRWGEYEESTISFFSEDSEIDGLDDPEIASHWFNTLSDEIGKIITLDDFYNIYNTFISTKTQLIKNYNANILDRSKDGASKIYPLKFFNPRGVKPSYYTAGGNKLRSSERGLFITIQRDDGTWTDSISDSNYYKYPNKYGKITTKDLLGIKKILSKLVGDSRFSFHIKNSKHMDNIVFRDLEKWAERSDKPLIVLPTKRKYSESLGIYDPNKLKLKLEKNEDNKINPVSNETEG